MRAVPVPRTLDTPARFLFWDVDYVMVATVGFCIGLIVAGITLGLCSMVVFSMGWSRARAGAGVSRAFAEMYWNLPVDVFERVPASARRHFVG